MGKKTGLFWNLFTSGTFDTFPTQVRSRIIFLNTITIVGLVTLIVFSAQAFATGIFPLGMSTAIVSGFVFFVFLFIRITRFFSFGAYAIVTIIGSLYSYLIWTGGAEGSGVLWAQTFPLIAVFLIGFAPGIPFSFSLWVFQGIVLLLPQLNPANFSLSYSLRVLGTYLFTFIFALLFEGIRSSTQKNLLKANEEIQLTTLELTHEKNQMDSIMSSVQEGIFILDKELMIQAPYSRHLEVIFERSDLEGLNFINLLRGSISERDLSASQDFLELFFTDNPNLPLLNEINPLSLIPSNILLFDGSMVIKYLKFTFHLLKDKAEPHVLVVVYDVTEETLLEQKLAQESVVNQRNMESLFQIIHVEPDMLQDYLADTDEELTALNNLLKAEDGDPAQIVLQMYQSIHAIKGNSTLLGLTEFSIKLHELEDKLKDLLGTKPGWKMLLQLTITLGNLRQQLDEMEELVQKIMTFQKSEAGVQPAGLLGRTLQRLAIREAERAGKIIQLNLENFKPEALPETLKKLIKDVLIQFVRNSIVHGLETREERLKSNKDLVGEIKIDLQEDSGSLSLIYRDDGRGFDLEGIRHKALENPAFKDMKVENMDEAHLAKLVFHPGFSTSDVSTLSAGRGIGLSLVKHRVEESGGTIKVRFLPGKFTEFIVKFPKMLA